MIPLLIFILFILGIETYSFFGLKASLFPNSKMFTSAFIITSLITIIGVLLLFKTMSSAEVHAKLYANLLFGLAFSFLISKLLVSSIFLIEDLFRGFTWLFQTATRFRLAETSTRSGLSGIIALTISAFLVLAMNYGVIFGRYQFKTHHTVLEFENLPEAFEGFKLVQISDMHLGTFDQLKRVQKGLKQLQDLNPDLIVFTGDMVNNRAQEVLPFIESIKQLHAPFGKYSVLGNHDYGEYVRWNSNAEKIENIEHLKQFQQQMGFTMLLNEHVALQKDGDTIYLAGVENWGNPPFPQYGDLDKAISGLDANKFIVLLSHDPTHWSQKVLSSPIPVALTLSGHTHGMQFGIEIGKFKWSPIKYRYEDWADLYTENGRNLYVNRGFGSLGFPGRVGIWPEITLFEFRKKK
ncbi:MAG: metallophosphoesterase [Prolixibacteraceae bacterium]